MANPLKAGGEKARREKRFDILLVLAAVAVLAIALLRGKGGGTTPVEAVAAAVTASPPRALTFTQWWGQAMDPDVLDGLAAEFEAAHRDVRIILDTRPREAVREALFAWDPAAGPRPFGDVVALDPLWAGALVDAGVVDAGEGSPDPAAPLVSFIHPFFYNITILREAGFSRPPKTRSEFLEMARAVTDPEAGRYGLVLGLGSGDGMRGDVYPWVLAAGAHLVDDDGEPALGSRAVADTLKFLGSLDEAGLLSPSSLVQGEEDKLRAFAVGRAAFMTAGVEAIETVRRQMGDGEFGITSVPAPDAYAGAPVFGVSGWSLGTSAREDARVFAAFLAERGEVLAEAAHAVPGAGGAPRDTEDPLYEKAWDLYTVGEVSAEGGDEVDQAFRAVLTSTGAPAP